MECPALFALKNGVRYALFALRKWNVLPYLLLKSGTLCLICVKEMECPALFAFKRWYVMPSLVPCLAGNPDYLCLICVKEME